MARKRASKLDDRLVRQPPGLRLIALQLNALREHPEDLPAAERSAWQAGQRLILRCLPDPFREEGKTLLGRRQVLEDFNTLAVGASLQLRVEPLRGGHIWPRIAATGLRSSARRAHAEMVLLVWEAFFHRRGWRRLKPCRSCSTWFVDPTKNCTALSCSDSCTNRWWTRERRSEAGHGRAKRPAKRQTRAA